MRTSVGGINLHYTCRGANVPPPLSWQGVSSTAKEVLVFVRTIGGGVKIQTDWALAGISPKVTALDPARLPKGTVVGRNSFGRIGYSLCPPAGSLVTLGVYAREQPLNLKRGFGQKGLLKYLQGPGVQWGGDTLSVRKSPGLASPSS